MTVIFQDTPYIGEVAFSGMSLSGGLVGADGSVNLRAALPEWRVSGRAPTVAPRSGVPLFGDILRAFNDPPDEIVFDTAEPKFHKPQLICRFRGDAVEESLLRSRDGRVRPHVELWAPELLRAITAAVSEELAR
jgi:hypothetical protein